MKTINELLTRQREINDELGALSAKCEMSDEDKSKEAALVREYEQNKREITLLNQNAEAERNKKPEVVKTACERLREVLKDVRDGKQAREITLAAGTVANANITASGAIALTIHDIMPTLNEGLGLPAGLSIVTGVTGNELWPVSLDDAEMEEVGETAQLTDQDLTFDKIQPTARRTGLSIVVSNTAIDNAAFDLLGFVQKKFALALKKYLAEKLYSQAAFTGNKGPFSGLTPAGTISLASDTYKSILAAAADFADKGYNVEKLCFVMDAVTEANLKATPKAAGQGGFIIENGKCAGYDYVVSHYINTELDSTTGKIKPTTGKVIGIGAFEYEAVQQHGEVRLTIDSTSKAVAVNNVTAIVLNTAWSMTDLSVKQTTSKGKSTGVTQAFALYTVSAS